jgi:transposase
VETCGHIQLIEQVVQQYRSDRWILIEDNLSIHTRKQTRLALTAWPGIQVQLLPKYAPWLNLIEPWLKQLRNRALKGRRFASTEEREQALRSRRSAELLPIGMLTRAPIAGRNARNSRSSLINRQSTDERRSKELAERTT